MTSPRPVLAGYRLVMPGLAHALLLCSFKACMLLTRLPWSGDLFAHSADHSWLLMAWVVFWSHIFCTLASFGVGLCQIVGFLFSSLSFYSFRSLAIVSCHITLLFLVWCYLVQACWASLGLLLMTQYSHLGLFGCTACGLLRPICFLLGILNSFAFLGLPWPFS